MVQGTSMETGIVLSGCMTAILSESEASRFQILPKMVEQLLCQLDRRPRTSKLLRETDITQRDSGK